MLCQVRIVARTRIWISGGVGDTIRVCHLLMERDPRVQGLTVPVSVSLSALRALDIDFVISWVGVTWCYAYVRQEDIEAVRLLSTWLRDDKQRLRPEDLNVECIDAKAWLTVNE